MRCLGSNPPFANFMHVRSYLPGLKKIVKVEFWSFRLPGLKKIVKVEFWSLWVPGLKKIEKLDFWSFEYLDSWIVATKQSLDWIEWTSLNKTNLDNDSWLKTKSHCLMWFRGRGLLPKCDMIIPWKIMEKHDNFRYKNEVDTLLKKNTTLTAYQCRIQKESRHYILQRKDRKSKEGGGWCSSYQHSKSEDKTSHKSRNRGWTSADRSTKATLMRTVPRSI